MMAHGKGITVIHNILVQKIPQFGIDNPEDMQFKHETRKDRSKRMFVNVSTPANSVAIKANFIKNIATNRCCDANIACVIWIHKG